MKKLVRANLVCIFQNLYYKFGLLTAFVVTALFTAYGEHYSVFQVHQKNDYMILISAAILAFFGTFTSFMVHQEMESGVIRNKLITGHTQKEVYLSQLFSHMLAGMLMVICWFIGGVLGGGKINGFLVSYTFILLFAVFSFIALLTFCGMRIKKNKTANFIGIVIFYVLLNGYLIGNALITFSKGVLHMVYKIIYQLSPLGQWGSHIYASSAYYRFPVGIEILLSMGMILLLTFVGTKDINKRDVN